MKRLGLSIAVVSFSTWVLAAQQPRTVQAVGTGSVSSKPDQVTLDLSIVTTASAANDASAQNAMQTTAAINQVQQVLGANATVATLFYTITPTYGNAPPQGPGPPPVAGYMVTNVLEVNAGNFSSIVKVIDAVAKVGSTSVQNLRFSLRDDTALRRQALSAAVKDGIARAQAIADGLGAHVGGIIAAQEGGSSGTALTPPPSVSPVSPGLITITATVTVIAQLTQ
jgi:uncharacterized protein YggE